MNRQEIEIHAAQWLKSKGYDRRTWKDTASVIAKYIKENNFSLLTKEPETKSDFVKKYNRKKGWN